MLYFAGIRLTPPCLTTGWHRYVARLYLFFSFSQPYYILICFVKVQISPVQEAINLTLYHWGLHGWVVYTIFGLLLSLMAHRY
jgi:choline-glycine betaine transporter